MTLPLIFVILLLAQDPPPPPPVPGVIVATKQSNLAITAGGLRCTITTANAGANVAAYCYVGTALVFNSTAAIFAVSDKLNGAGLSYFYHSDMITAVFYRPTQGGPVLWEIVANGTVKGDAF